MASPTFAGIDAASVKKSRFIFEKNKQPCQYKKPRNDFDICEAIRRLDRTYFTV